MKNIMKFIISNDVTIARVALKKFWYISPSFEKIQRNLSPSYSNIFRHTYVGEFQSHFCCKTSFIDYELER